MILRMAMAIACSVPILSAQSASIITGQLFTVSGNWMLVVDNPNATASIVANNGATAAVSSNASLVRAEATGGDSTGHDGPNQAQDATSSLSTWQWSWAASDVYEVQPKAPRSECTMDITGDSVMNLVVTGSGITAVTLDLAVAAEAAIANNIGGGVARRLENARSLTATPSFGLSLEGVSVQFATNQGEGSYPLPVLPAHDFSGPSQSHVYDLSHAGAGVAGVYAEAGLFSPSAHGWADVMLSMRSRTRLYEQ